MNNFSNENLVKLFAAVHDDIELSEMVCNCLKSFQAYHQAIFDMETWLSLYDYNNMPREDYQDKLTKLDECRTSCHNIVIDSVSILNRMAVQYSIPAIYDGEVARGYPHRREIADAVLGYVENIILARR